MPLVKVTLKVEIMVEAENLPKGLDIALAMVELPETPTTGSGVLVTRESQIPRDWKGKRPFIGRYQDGAVMRSSRRCEEVIAAEKGKRK